MENNHINFYMFKEKIIAIKSIKRKIEINMHMIDVFVNNVSK